VKISTKARYGTRAIIDIGEHFGKRPVSLRKLAERQCISIKYMEQIVPLLKASGLIRSTRGALGGYVLAKEPGEISLRDILQATEGSWSLVDCLDDDKLCGRARECVTYEIWHDIQTSIYRILDSTTLADMINRHREKAKT
jgi:Rrf2 family cysteine metabolism transcriptional repressor